VNGNSFSTSGLHLQSSGPRCFFQLYEFLPGLIVLFAPPLECSAIDRNIIVIMNRSRLYQFVIFISRALEMTQELALTAHFHPYMFPYFTTGMRLAIIAENQEKSSLEFSP